MTSGGIRVQGLGLYWGFKGIMENENGNCYLGLV